MKKILLLLGLLPGILSAQSIRAIYSTPTFNSPQGPYVEINTSIDATSLNYVDVSGEQRSNVELTVTIARDDDPETFVYADKRQLGIDKEQSIDRQILDIQRVMLGNGNYVLTLELDDMNSNAEPTKIKDWIKISYPEKGISMSDVQIIEEPKKAKGNAVNVKNGYEITPYMFDVISKNENVINYYAEIYGADEYFGKDSVYMLLAVVEDLTTNKRQESAIQAKRIKAKDITVIMGEVHIDSLYEGSYYLTVEVRDSKNILYAFKRDAFFRQSDRKNPAMNMDIPKDAFVFSMTDEQLTQNIENLYPIANDDVKSFIDKELKTATREVKMYFLYSFWKRENEASPQTAWQEYTTRLDFVNRKYSTNIKKGYETDMGRVYLLYGPPTNIIDEKFKGTSGFKRRTREDMMATPELTKANADGVVYLPYQMWRYDRTPFGETNRTFVFYAPQNNMAEYFLLHSNAKGEKQEIYWESVLSRHTLEEGVEGDAGIQFRKGHL